MQYSREEDKPYPNNNNNNNNKMCYYLLLLLLTTSSIIDPAATATCSTTATTTTTTVPSYPFTCTNTDLSHTGTPLPGNSSDPSNTAVRRLVPAWPP